MQKIICKGNVIEYLPFYRVIDGVPYLKEKEEIDTQLIKDFEEDFPHFKDEIEDVKLKRIKRYKKIVDILKEAYKGKCQICGFTFVKSNDDNYSEAHHLNPLAQGGSQDEENVVVLCANHHRMLHYGKNIKVGEKVGNSRFVIINTVKLEIKY